jgi:hypothetical protein
MTSTRTLATLALAFFASTHAAAALVQTSGLITHLRIEAGAAFIGFTVPMGQCTERVWVDLNSPVNRAIYATALAAFQARQPVVLRAHEESQRMFGACQLYDIVMLPQ